MTACAVLHSEPIHLARELLAELFEEIVTQQLLLKRVEDALLDFITSNGQAIRARALVSCAKAHQPICGADDEPRAALTALRQPGEQVTRTVRRSSLPVDAIARRVCVWRSFAADHSSSGTIRKCGTSVVILSEDGFSLDTRLPVSGFFT